MTTLLFCPTTKSIYADMRTTRGTFIQSDQTAKIEPVYVEQLSEICLFAAAGDWDTRQRCIEYLSGSIDKPHLTEKDDLKAMLLLPNGGFYEIFSPSLHLVPSDAEPLAFGSGAEIAMTAYHLTHCPIKSVQTAIDLDVFSGGRIMRGFFNSENEPVIREVRV